MAARLLGDRWLMAILLMLQGFSTALRSLLVIAGHPVQTDSDSGPDREL